MIYYSNNNLVRLLPTTELDHLVNKNIFWEDVKKEIYRCALHYLYSRYFSYTTELDHGQTVRKSHLKGLTSCMFCIKNNYVSMFSSKSSA